MLIGVSTRKYGRSLEKVPEEVKTKGTSRSAVSRRFVAATTAQFDGWLRRDRPSCSVPMSGLGPRTTSHRRSMRGYTIHRSGMAFRIDSRSCSRRRPEDGPASSRRWNSRSLATDTVASSCRSFAACLMMNDGAEMTLKEIDHHFGLSRERIESMIAHQRSRIDDHGHAIDCFEQ